MKTHDYKNILQVTAVLGSLIALSGTAAQANITEYDPTNGSAALLNNGATTAPYSLGDAQGTLASPYAVPVGSNTATFIATTEPTGAHAFEGFRNQVSLITGTSFDFPAGTAFDANGTHLIDTFDPTHPPTNIDGITGPLEIDFATPVGAFGIKSQDAAVDTELFTVSVYDASNTLLSTGTSCVDANNGNAPCSFQTPTYNNNTGNGKSVFLGAASTMADISRVVISSFSTASDPVTGIFNYHGNSNDIYSGPLTVGDPVPEASTFTGFGMGTLLFGGLLWNSRKRKTAKSSQTAA